MNKSKKGLSRILNKRKELIDKAVAMYVAGKITKDNLEKLLEDIEAKYPISEQQTQVIKEWADYNWKHRVSFKG